MKATSGDTRHLFVYVYYCSEDAALCEHDVSVLTSLRLVVLENNLPLESPRKPQGMPGKPLKTKQKSRQNKLTKK